VPSSGLRSRAFYSSSLSESATWRIRQGATHSRYQTEVPSQHEWITLQNWMERATPPSGRLRSGFVTFVNANRLKADLQPSQSKCGSYIRVGRYISASTAIRPQTTATP